MKVVNGVEEMKKYYCDYCGKDIEHVGKKAGVVYKLVINGLLRTEENSYDLCFSCKNAIIRHIKEARQAGLRKK